MSNIEQHVVSLELAKQLKSAGYPQETGGFGWYRNGNGYTLLYSPDFLPMLQKWVAAPLVSELGVLLPDHVVEDGDMFELAVEKLGNSWMYSYNTNDLPRPKNHSSADIAAALETKEADARARLWLELKEAGLL